MNRFCINLANFVYFWSGERVNLGTFYAVCAGSDDIFLVLSTVGWSKLSVDFMSIVDMVKKYSCLVVECWV